MANEDIEQTRHNAAIAKRQASKDRLEAETEAFTKALKTVFKKSLTDEDTRAKIHAETQNGQRGLAVNPEMVRMAKATSKGSGGVFGDLDDVETGFEKRYWEQDE